MLITISTFAAISVTINFVMIWYIRKLLLLQEDINSELYEEILVFQEHLETILKTDVFAGEPMLVKLLDDIRAFADSTEKTRIKLLPANEKNTGE